LLGGQSGGCDWGHDNIDLERNQFGRKSGVPIELPLGKSVFDHEVTALDVTEVMQSLEEGVSHVAARGGVGPQPAYSSDLGRLLRLGGERHSTKRHECNYRFTPVHLLPVGRCDSENVSRNCRTHRP
jgi:hypothetical protein